MRERGCIEMSLRLVKPYVYVKRYITALTPIYLLSPNE